uniref:beta-1,4-galactosyltransferase 2-like n=1 Tax=Styela clava TaxID=7725 RepID=UPI00193AC2CB|nr:beta-1,4-galactosyltransferase 2-like [Styela clava]
MTHYNVFYNILIHLRSSSRCYIMLIGSIGLNKKVKLCMTAFVAASLFVYIILALSAGQVSLESLKTKKTGWVSPWKLHYGIYKPKPGQKIARVADRKRIITRFGLVDIMSLNDNTRLSHDDLLRASAFFMYDEFEKNSQKQFLTFKNQKEKYPNWTDNDPLQPMGKPLCPIIPPELKGKFKDKPDDSNQPSLQNISIANPDLTLGGKYTPPCHPRSKIAIIIPLRGRETQLRTLLAHMHPIWQRQQIDYTVYVVSQEANNRTFNKAKLMNAGFLEASKYDTYDCFVFHDVDLLLEDDRCLYRCVDSDNARILAARMDKFNYTEQAYMMPCKPKEYPDESPAIYFGGVAMMTSRQFYRTNGYSNLFWGWGSEDMDMYFRLWHRGHEVVQPYGEMCSYHMIKHEHEKLNKENDGRFGLLKNSIDRMKYDGLTSIRYKILSVERNRLFTNITLSIGYPNKPLLEFMNQEYDSFEDKCEAKAPWQLT